MSDLSALAEQYANLYESARRDLGGKELKQWEAAVNNLSSLEERVEVGKALLKKLSYKTFGKRLVRIARSLEFP